MEDTRELPDHSLAKVRLLGAYLKRFLSVISNDGFTKRICIYDLFCSTGEGSPRVIMSEVKGLYFSRKARSLEVPIIDCYFNDLDTVKVNQAKELIKVENLHYPEFGSLKFGSQDYKELVIELKQHLDVGKTTKNFIFVDPYGYKDIKASDIKDLLTRGNTEVLLWLPIQFMYRFDKNSTPIALQDFIQEIVDIRSWKESDDVWRFIDQLKTGFQNFFGTGTFVDTFSIQKDPQTVFCLFFFSRHIKGFEKMLEAKWNVDAEQGRGWHFRRNQHGSLFSTQITNPLENDLRSFLATGPKSNRELYEFTLGCGYLPKHTVEVLKSLQDGDELNVTGSGGKEVRKGTFYINYKCYRDEPRKVEFRLK